MTEKHSNWNINVLLKINMLFLWILATFGITLTNADKELFQCDFERQCILGQERKNDDFDWTLNQGVTDQWFTGPSSDHTVGDETGHYFYAQSDINNFDTSAQLFSPKFNLTRRTARLVFYYHMYDARYPDNMGTLNIYAHPCGDEQLVFSRTGNQGYLWKKAEVELNCDREVQIAFEAVRGGTESDIAIDDISLVDVFDLSNPSATQLPATAEPVTESVTRWSPPMGGKTDHILWPVGTHSSPLMQTTQQPTTETIPENTSLPTTAFPTPKIRQTPSKMRTDEKSQVPPDDGSSTPETTISTAIWGPPNRTLGESTAIIGAAIAVGVLCVLILILIVLVWKTRSRKPDDQGRRGEMYENQAFNRSQDLHLHQHIDPSYTALQFQRTRSTASTLQAPAPPKRRYSPDGKYIGLSRPSNSDSCICKSGVKHNGSKHTSGISTISTTRSRNSNDFGSTMEGSIGIYESVGQPGSRRHTPRRVPSEFLGNPVYIGGNESDLELRSSAKLPCSAKFSNTVKLPESSDKIPTGSEGKLPAGTYQTPMEPKYYTVLPDVVDSLHYKMHMSGAQTVPCHGKTWHVADTYAPSNLSNSEDSDIEGSRDSVYADIDDTRSSLSDYSGAEMNGNVYGPYEIEC